MNTELSCWQKNIFNNNKIHLISYGDKKYTNAKKRVFKEAYDTNWFYSIKCYDKKDITSTFKNEFSNILSLSRGGGYWLWKFDIIMNKLNKIKEGEFLIYIDSGCTVNINGEKRLKDYIEMIKKNEKKIISFQSDHKENFYTTKQIFESFNISESNTIFTSGHYIATVLIMQKCQSVSDLFNKCIQKIKKNPLIITDHYNRSQKSYFKDNRHDQSILSVARKLYGSIVLPDETYSTNFNSESMRKIPFLATRKRR